MRFLAVYFIVLLGWNAIQAGSGMSGPRKPTPFPNLEKSLKEAHAYEDKHREMNSWSSMRLRDYRLEYFEHPDANQELVDQVMYHVLAYETDDAKLIFSKAFFRRGGEVDGVLLAAILEDALRNKNPHIDQVYSDCLQYCHVTLEWVDFCFNQVTEGWREPICIAYVKGPNAQKDRVEKFLLDVRKWDRLWQRLNFYRAYLRCSYVDDIEAHRIIVWAMTRQEEWEKTVYSNSIYSDYLMSSAANSEMVSKVMVATGEVRSPGLRAATYKAYLQREDATLKKTLRILKDIFSAGEEESHEWQMDKLYRAYFSRSKIHHEVIKLMLKQLEAFDDPKHRCSIYQAYLEHPGVAAEFHQAVIQPLLPHLKQPDGESYQAWHDLAMFYIALEQATDAQLDLIFEAVKDREWARREYFAAFVKRPNAELWIPRIRGIGSNFASAWPYPKEKCYLNEVGLDPETEETLEDRAKPGEGGV